MIAWYWVVLIVIYAIGFVCRMWAILFNEAIGEAFGWYGHLSAIGLIIQAALWPITGLIYFIKGRQ